MVPTYLPLKLLFNKIISQNIQLFLISVNIPYENFIKERREYYLRCFRPADNTNTFSNATNVNYNLICTVIFNLSMWDKSSQHPHMLTPVRYHVKLDLNYCESSIL